MNVLSLFDGISCGRVALERAGVNVNKYYAAEIDKHATFIAAKNWPDNMQLGDVTEWRNWHIDWASIDLLIGGSPCQGFSFAGKQLAFDDPRSALFFVYADILNHIRSVNPNVKFILENVKMKKEHLAVISETLGVEPIFINSDLVSAQSRQRFYWCNWHVTQPQDKGILLNHILENGYHATREKAYCLDANYGKGSNFRRYFFMGSRQIVLESGYMPQNLTKETANEIMHRDENRWRLLSVAECEKLQNLPAGYVENVEVPKFEKYKAIGNGWTVDVIVHILGCLTGRIC